MKDNNIRAIVEAKAAGKKVAAIDFVETNPEIPAAISKLVKSIVPVEYDNKGQRTITTTDQGTMRAASSQIAQKTKDADIVMELFPEMELAAQILISSVISPNDMNTTEVGYIVPENLKVSPISHSLLPVVKEYFDNSYKIDQLLPTILEDVLFRTGSYPVAVIPENSVDDLINGSSSVSTEALRSLASSEGTFHPIGILGNPNKTETHNFSLESINTLRSKAQSSADSRKVVVKDAVGKKEITLEHLYITDNYNGLKLPKIIERARQQSVDSIIANNGFSADQYSSESFSSNLSDIQLSDLFYKNKSAAYKNLVKVKTDDELARQSVGEPLILKLPSESVIPVYTPGNEKEHVGYFVLLDGEGNPLSSRSTYINESDLRSSLSGNSDMNSYLLNRASKNFNNDCRQVTFRDASKIFADIVEADLLARLRNGIVGPVVTVGKNEDIYRIMLARTLMKQNTQLLYIPNKLLTYFAFKYSDYGVGESLLDKMRNLNSLRAMLLFSKVMAQVKNSIGREAVNIKLDPTDPNPQKTIEIAMHEIAKTRSQGFPLGINEAGDLVDWIQKSGLQYTFEGHPGLPDVKIDYSEVSTNFTEPSSDLSDDLRKSSIMATGLSPETVDNGFQADFATTVAANNLLLAKRVKKIQEAFVPQLTDHCRKVVLYNAYVVNQIKNIIRENISKITDNQNADPIVLKFKDNTELLVHILTLEFLSNFELTLAQPDAIVLKNQAEAFNTQEELLDKALNYYINDSILPSSMVGEEASQRVMEVKEIVKAHFMRKWMNQNHVLSDLSQIGVTDDEGKPVLDFGHIFENFVNGMSKSIVELLRRTVPVGKAATTDIEKISGDQDLGESSVTDTSSDTGGDEGGSDDMGGFGGDDDPFASGNLGGGEGDGDDLTEGDDALGDI